MPPMVSHMNKVRLAVAFKDGNLFPLLVNAGFQPYENIPGTVMPGVAWIDDRLLEMLRNSGADVEVEDRRLNIPPPTGPTSEAKAEPEPEPEPELDFVLAEEPEIDEFLESITLDDLLFTGPAKAVAKENGIIAEELLDTLGEWELKSGEWKEHKFTKAEVMALVEKLEG